MKKLLLAFFLLLQIITFSENLERIAYDKGNYKAYLKESVTISYDEKLNTAQNVLIVEFKNLKLKKTLPTTIPIQDALVDSVTLEEGKTTTKMTFFLKKNTEYEIKNSKGVFTINFKKGKAKKKNYTIIIDAGHGGHDNGAMGNGLREKDVALTVAQYLASDLKDEYNIIMTRNTDVFIPLAERAQIGNRANADLFVSIHLNSASSSSANGAEVFYFSKKESSYAAEVAKFENSFDKGNATVPMSDFIVNDILYRMNQQESAAIASDILENIVDNFGLRKRGIFGANFAVLRGSHSPSILIEIGFISNSGDMAIYETQERKKDLAKRIADAIRNNYD